MHLGLRLRGGGHDVVGYDIVPEKVQALVALGGDGVDAARLAAILWPDASGDAAKVSFDRTLYRLRKLIGLDAALALNEGKLSLDPRYCWVDVDAFERAARDADAVAQDPAAAPERIASAAASLQAAYPGHFLAGDEDQHWLMAMRDRLRAKIARRRNGGAISAFQAHFTRRGAVG